jgi:type IV pilus assembly protein PilE
MKWDGAAGFTLIELMVVVVVLAILVGVAYPSYQDHIRKAKRAEGKTALLKTAQVLERWYSDKNTYGTSPAPPYPPAPTAIDIAPLYGKALTTIIYSGENPTDNQGSYTITAAAPDAATCPIDACFLITATPNAPFVDPLCGNFTLTSTGTRGWSTPVDATTTARCKW